MPLILSDLATVRGDTVQSFQGDSVYYAGSLSLRKRLWFPLSQHVVLFTVVAFAVVILAAMLL